MFVFLFTKIRKHLAYNNAIVFTMKLNKDKKKKKYILISYINSFRKY